jgi:Cupin
MIDPLSDVVALLRPRTVFTKGISGAGAWGVRYADFGQPSFCTVLEGRCRLHVDGQAPINLEASDFVLLPATPGFVLSGLEPVTPEFIDPKVTAAPVEEVRHGRHEGDPDVRLLGGYFIFDSPDAGLLVSLLPPLVHIRAADRLERLNTGRVEIWCSHASLRCCSSRRCALCQAKTRPLACCAGWRTSGSRRRSD